MNTLRKTWSGGCVGKLVIVALFLGVVLCCFVALIAALPTDDSVTPGGESVPEVTNTPRPTTKATDTPKASDEKQDEEKVEPTEPPPTSTPNPTEPPPPTNTPRPTNTPKPKPTATPDYGDEIAAEVMCQGFVEDRLKAPSTADFGGWLEDRDTALWWDKESLENIGYDTSNLHSPGYWVVIGSVDAENSFGAMLRNEYTCILDYQAEGEMWHLIDISIE